MPHHSVFSVADNHPRLSVENYTYQRIHAPRKIQPHGAVVIINAGTSHLSGIARSNL